MAEHDDETGLSTNFFVGAGERDAITIVRDASRQALPKRFYKSVTVEARDGAFVILLDGKAMRTPKQAALVLPTLAGADLVAAEWTLQGDTIDPASMPATRLVNSALDGVSRDVRATAAEVVRYAGSDLVCYRASDPPALVAAQSDAWDPVLAWARETIGARFITTEGIIFADQPPAAIAAVQVAVDRIEASPHAVLRIAAVSVLTTLTGSALIALAVDAQSLTPDSAWDAAHVDEDEQMRIWGFDAEALRRRAKRRDEFNAACGLLASLR